MRALSRVVEVGRRDQRDVAIGGDQCVEVAQPQPVVVQQRPAAGRAVRRGDIGGADDPTAVVDAPSLAVRVAGKASEAVRGDAGVPVLPQRNAPSSSVA